MLQTEHESPGTPLSHLPELGSFSLIEGGVCGRQAEMAFEQRGKKNKLENALRMRLLCEQDMEAYKALTIGGWKARPMEVSFARRADTKEAAFLAAFTTDPKRALPELRIVSATNEKLVFSVQADGKPHTVTIDVADQQATVTRDP